MQQTTQQIMNGFLFVEQLSDCIYYLRQSLVHFPQVNLS